MNQYLSFLFLRHNPVIDRKLDENKLKIAINLSFNNVSCISLDNGH